MFLRSVMIFLDVETICFRYIILYRTFVARCFEEKILSAKEQRLFHASCIRNLINRQQQFSYRYARLNVTSCTRIFSPVKALQFARVILVGAARSLVATTSLTIPIPSHQPCVGTRFDRAKWLITLRFPIHSIFIPSLSTDDYRVHPLDKTEREREEKKSINIHAGKRKDSPILYLASWHDT